MLEEGRGVVLFQQADFIAGGIVGNEVHQSFLRLLALKPRAMVGSYVSAPVSANSYRGIRNGVHIAPSLSFFAPRIVSPR